MDRPQEVVDRLLEDLSGEYAIPYTNAVSDLYVALVTDNRPAAADARRLLEEVTRETMGAGEIVGASTVLLAAARLMDTAPAEVARFARMSFATPKQTVIPRVKFGEAIANLIERTPVTVRSAAERTAQRIAELYGEKVVIAFARSAEASVTREAKTYIERAMRAGMTENRAAQELAMTVNEVRKRSAEWSEAYARMVFRTNVNTAVTAGRFRQAQDPVVKKVIPALRYDAVGDSDTRSNHRAADGVLLRSDNPGWAKLAPPMGYNCRCQVSLVSIPQLQAAGRLDKNGNVKESKIPPAAKPDDGFRHGGRPDLMLAGR